MGKDRGKNKLKDASKLPGRVIEEDNLRRPQSVEGNGVLQLIPALPNDVVLAQVVPKLPWRAFYILSLVSRSWRDAIQSRQVYDARVGSNSLERVVVVNHNYPSNWSIQAISIYSMRDDSWHLLPTFPFYKRGIPKACQITALDGRLYVLGGDEQDDDDDFEEDKSEEECDPEALDFHNSEDSDDRTQLPKIGTEVFVLDLVGQTGWRRCANMPEPRYDFGCGVVDGKVYVLGGYSRGESIRECLVYDPKKDRWSSIAPMTETRSRHHVVTVGDELSVHGGELRRGHPALIPELYNPGKDRWDSLESGRCHGSEHVFTFQGKFYLMTPTILYEVKRWTRSTRRSRLRLISIPEQLEDFDEDELEVVAAQAVDDEILAIVCWSDARETQGGMLRSKGFGIGNGTIEFEIVGSEIFIEHQWYPHLMCPLEL